MDRNEVSTASEIVLKEVESVVDSLNEDGAGAFKKGDCESAKKLIEDATQLTDFSSKVRNLQKEWDSLFSAKIPIRAEISKKPVKRSYSTRRERGLRTP
jgi:restriction system protein